MANWVDVVAVIIVAGFIFSGIQRGIMKTFLDVLAVLIAIFFSGQLYRSLTNSIMPFLKAQDPTIYAITFIIFWIISFLVLELFVGYIMKLVKISFIGAVESLGGILLGLLQGVLIAGIAIQICLMLPLSTGTKDIFTDSISKKIAIPTLSKSYLSIFGMFPKIDFIQQNLQRIQEQVVPAIPTKEKLNQPPAAVKIKHPNL
jgi:uncharacterized membrane protein required for colicin V production